MRAQTSFEFFVAFSFLIFLFLVSLAIYEEEVKSADVALSKMSAQAVASDFSRTVNGVYRCGSGCSYALHLKEGYLLSVYGRVVVASKDSQIGEAPLVTDDVSIQSATPGRNILVVNNNGVVELHDE